MTSTTPFSKLPFWPKRIVNPASHNRCSRWIGSEKAPAPFLNSPGLLPLAVLTQSQNPTERLREVALALDTIEDRGAKANLTTASAVFGGPLVKPELIRTILRSDIMKESAIYQEILQEGE